MSDLLTEALERFESVYRRARDLEPAAATRMALATADSDGRPSVRTMRFTGLHDGGFSFFANRTSGKGRQLEQNPWASLCFLWPDLRAQVVVGGRVATLPEAAADALWKARPRAAALMAWASEQSLEATDPNELGARYLEASKRFTDERVPRPPDWLAYAVQPQRIEFWSGEWESRQHRDAYECVDGLWRYRHLNP
ncbi:MAG: pyridoxal 5'-phosphate synthase [Pseudomonadales bacterium]